MGYLTGQQHKLPVKAKKAAVRERYFNYLVFRNNNKLILRERSDRDIWQNLYDFWLLETDEPKIVLRELPLPDHIQEVVNIGSQQGDSVEAVQLLSHQRIRGVFYLIDLPDEAVGRLPSSLQWYTLSEIDYLPKPVLIKNYLDKVFG